MITREPPESRFNPYAAPIATVQEDDPEAVALRWPNLSREAAVRVLGLVGYLLAVPFVLLGVNLLILVLLGVMDALMTRRFSMNLVVADIVGQVSLGLGVAIAIFMGRDLRRFRAWALVLWSLLIPNVLAACLCFAVPLALTHVGLLAGIGMLLVAVPPTVVMGILLSSRTNRLFRAEYREAIARSPGLRARFSLGDGLLFALILGLTVAGGVILAVSSRL